MNDASQLRGVVGGMQLLLTLVPGLPLLSATLLLLVGRHLPKAMVTAMWRKAV